MKQGSAKYFWGEVRSLYDRLKVLTKHEQAEVEPIASGKLQTRYEDLDARVEKALDDYYLKLKASKVRILGEKWRGAYLYIEAALAQLQTRLEGEPIIYLKVLELKSDKLTEIKARIDSATALVDSMYTVDLKQSVVMLEAQSARRTAVEIKVNACIKLIASRREAINRENAAAVGAAADAAIAEVAEPPPAKKRLPNLQRSLLLLRKKRYRARNLQRKRSRLNQLPWQLS